MVKKTNLLCRDRTSSAAISSRGEWGGALDHSSIRPCYCSCSRYSIIIHANWRQFRWELELFAIDFFELMRVDACHWKCRPPMVSTMYLSNKKLRFYCAIWHTKLTKFFGQAFYLHPKWKTLIFPILSQVRDLFSDFFTLFSKSFLLISWVKWTSKSHEMPLGPFRNNCFIRFLRQSSFVRQIFLTNIRYSGSFA